MRAPRGTYCAWDEAPTKQSGGNVLARGAWDEVIAAVAARLLNGDPVVLFRMDPPEGLPTHLIDALADGTPIDRADGSALDLSETEALRDWRAGVALRVRS